MMSQSTSFSFHKPSIHPKITKPKSHFLPNTLHSFPNCPAHKNKESVFASLQSSSTSGNTQFQSNTSPHTNSPTKNIKSFFSSIFAPPLHPSVDPTQVLTGNFAPVTELHPTECTVIEGEIPTSLNGVFLRIGPNPQHMPSGALHYTEGDGMVHCLKISNGRATYCSRFVKTNKYMVEREAGSPIFPNIVSGLYGLADIGRYINFLSKVWTGDINLKRGIGIANTSVVLFSDKLLALGESDLPYAIDLTKEGDVETLGRWDFDKKLLANMTSHPKIDKATNEMFSFRWTITYPYLSYFYFNENGVKQQEVHISSVREPPFLHDFAITKRFAVFAENQFVVSVPNAILGKSMAVVYKPTKVPRIGILPRYATSGEDMKWYSVAGFNCFHIINAWDNGKDEIVLVAPNIRNIESAYPDIQNVGFSLEKVTINISTENVSRNSLSVRKNLEMGTINNFYVGKKSRYGYFGVVDESVPKMSGLVKVDIENGCEAATRLYGPNCFGGEPFFVPRDGSNIDADEDDGYVVNFVYDEISGESKFLVMDAKSPKLEVVTEIKLPRRVPYGFHGLFIDEKNLPN